VVGTPRRQLAARRDNAFRWGDRGRRDVRP
jgi:hypothetical protein